MKILILGGSGFIGSHIVDKLVSLGYSVRVYCKSSEKILNLQLSIKKIELFQGDLSNEELLNKALDGVSVVVHLISSSIPSTSNKDFADDLQENVIKTLKLFELAKKSGVLKIIFASSGGTIYGIPSQLPILESQLCNPICSYGISKLIIEKYLYLHNYLYGIDYAVLRISNPYGPRQNPFGNVGFINVLLSSVMNKKPITIWGDGTVSRDFLYISDLVDVFIKAIELNTPSRVYNVGSGKSYSLNDVIQISREVTGSPVEVFYSSSRIHDVPINYLDINLAKNELFWSPKVNIIDGVRLLWNNINCRN
jgi:UDP-glucose 4-epimerase